MVDTKMKSAKKKKIPTLRPVTAARVGMTVPRAEQESVVVVISGTTKAASVRHVVVNKPKDRMMFVTMPSENSLEFMRRSDEATSGGSQLFGRRRGL